MDKIFSTRMDESVINTVDMLAHRLKTSKKNIIEMAVQMYEKSVKEKKKIDVFAQTWGAWKRNETATQIVDKAKATFRQSMKRHQE